MKRLIFKLTLLSDIIVHADSATEGERKPLDFIPGSNFLGLVAKHYDDFTNPYDIFHNNKVRFGDAHISKNDHKSFKAPLSWFFKKGESIIENKWVHHFLSTESRNKLTKEDIQIKQARNGWIAPDSDDSGTLFSLRLNFAIKSAYDRNTRTSKEGQLFGYKALEAGTEWIFYVDTDNDIEESTIVNKLIGEKHIGKSRSAQYGKVFIEKIENNAQDISTDKLYKDKYLIIYAESRLIFFNEYGQPTLQPKIKDFNLNNNWKLDWSKSQTRSTTFAPYNFKNRSFLTDRVCFEKGSVFVFEKLNGAVYEKSTLLDGVGEYKNEGFGQIIINPVFLNANENGVSSFALKKDEEENKRIFAVKEKDPSDASIIEWFEQKEQTANAEHDIYKKIKTFVTNNAQKFKDVSSSQWGQIRAIARSSHDFDDMEDWLFKTVTASSEDGIERSHDKAVSGFLSHGKMEHKWKRGKETLKNELENNKNYGTEYAERLATQMQKWAKRNGKEVINEL